MTKITDETPIAMLTVGQLKEILGIDQILGNLTANRTPTEQVMTIEEVVRLTGYSKATIYKFTSDRKIPFRQAGAWRKASLLSARGDYRLVAKRIAPDDRTIL